MAPGSRPLMERCTFTGFKRNEVGREPGVHGAVAPRAGHRRRRQHRSAAAPLCADCTCHPRVTIPLRLNWWTWMDPGWLEG